jgi:hypothetical protein
MPQSSPGTSTQSRITQLSLLFHLRKTGMLVLAVLADARVHPARKLAFVGVAGSLLALVLFPEMLADVFTAVIPFVNVLGLGIEIPAEVGFDWVFFAVAAFNLLRLFPTEIVGEHYDRLFRQ